LDCEKNPFNANPDPRYLFLTRRFKSPGGARLRIKNRKGFILLTGESHGQDYAAKPLAGLAKPEGVATAYIFNSQLDTTQLFDFMMADFGIPCESRDKSHVLMRLNIGYCNAIAIARLGLDRG